MPIDMLRRCIAPIRRKIQHVLGTGVDRTADVPMRQIQALFQRYPGARRELVHLAQLERHVHTARSAAGLPAFVIEHALDELAIAMADGRATDVLALRGWLLAVFSAQADSQLSSTSWAPTAFLNSSLEPTSGGAIARDRPAR